MLIQSFWGSLILGFMMMQAGMITAGIIMYALAWLSLASIILSFFHNFKKWKMKIEVEEEAIDSLTELLMETLEELKEEYGKATKKNSK